MNEVVKKQINNGLKQTNLFSKSHFKAIIKMTSLVRLIPAPGLRQQDDRGLMGR